MKARLQLTVNGKTVEATVDPRVLLADFLRDHLGLTGTHVGCGTGSCGTCTVMVDNLTVKSCTVLAADVDGAEGRTIEGFTPGDGLHPIQQAFVRRHALQCGFCTPGMVLSAAQLLRDNPDPSEDEIRKGIAGNLCRCTGYQNIVTAISEAARALRGA